MKPRVRVAAYDQTNAADSSNLIASPTGTSLAEYLGLDATLSSLSPGIRATATAANAFGIRAEQDASVPFYPVEPSEMYQATVDIIANPNALSLYIRIQWWDAASLISTSDGSISTSTGARILTAEAPANALSAKVVIQSTAGAIGNTFDVNNVSLSKAPLIKLDSRRLQAGELALLLLQGDGSGSAPTPGQSGWTQVGATLTQDQLVYKLYKRVWTDVDPDELTATFTGAQYHRAMLFACYGWIGNPDVVTQQALGTPQVPAFTADESQTMLIRGIMSANGNRYTLSSATPEVDLYTDLSSSGKTLAVWLSESPEAGDTAPATTVGQDIPESEIPADDYIGFVIGISPSHPQSTIATETYDDMAPLIDALGDPDNFFRTYTRAIGRMFRQVEQVVDDHPDGTSGYGTSLDVDKAPKEVLPWLAVLSGSPGKRGYNLRDEVRAKHSHDRGTIESLIEVVQDRLTGSKTVYVFERQGSAYAMSINYLASESTGLAGIQAAVAAAKPAGLIVTVNEIAGGTFNTLRDTHSDFADVTATFSDFNDIVSDPSQT